MMTNQNKIETVFEDFKTFFKDNNFPVFYAIENQKEDPTEHDNELMDIEAIKEFILLLKPKFIQITVDRVVIREGLNPDRLTLIEEKDRFRQLFSELEGFNNSIMFLTITLPIVEFSNLSFCFSSEKMEEISEYTVLCKEIIEYQADFDEENNEEDDEEEEDSSIIKIKTLSKEETDNYINSLINDNDFIATSLLAHRKDYMFELFENDLNPSNIAELIPKAERALEKYLKNKIKELKTLGKRKFEIMAELGISKHRIDKYF